MNAAAIVFAALAALFLVLLLLLMRFITRLGSAERQKKKAAYDDLNRNVAHAQTVFVGDSITEGFHVNEYFAAYAAKTGSTVYNRGISAETSAEMLARFEDNVLCIQPKNIVVLMGTNDLGQKIPPKTVAENINAALNLARQQCPDANIILQAVYPINRDVGGKLMQLLFGGGRTPAGIARLNHLLWEIATAHNALWLDLSGPLSGETGELKKELTGDGLHLNERGYSIVAKYVLPLLR